MENTFFPPFLNVGSKDIGKNGPVRCLQKWLLGLPKSLDLPELDVKGLEVDGDYGKMTASVVSQLQVWLDIEADGNFGPNTRTTLKNWHIIDFDDIPSSENFQDEIVRYIDDKNTERIWPPQART